MNATWGNLDHTVAHRQTRPRRPRLAKQRLFVALVSVGVVASARAANVTLQHGVDNYTGTADAWLDEGAKTRNYGGSAYLRVQYNNGMSDCTVLRFDLPSLPFQSLTAATLGLYYYDHSSMQSDNAVWITPYRITNGMSWFENVFDGVSGYGVNWRYRDHAQTQPWTLESAAWYDKINDGNSTNKIKRPGGSVPDAIEPPNWVTWDVRNSVAQWYAGQQNNGFVLFESGFQGGGFIAAGLFYSREHGAPQLRPYLNLTFQGAHIGWAGYANATWDTNAVNWNVGGARGRYGDADFVTFADGANFSTISIAPGGVAPGGVTISNHSLAYTFGGGSIGGSGGVTKTGSGQATLAAANSYSGLTLVQAGRLIVSANHALGGSAAGTIVSNGAALGLQAVDYAAAESLTLSGSGVASSGALYAAGGNSSFAGPISLAADASVGADTGLSLTLNNTIIGPFGLTKLGAGTLTLGGAAANSYAGPTRVNRGTLLLAKTTGLAVPGTLFIGEGAQPATVRLQNHGQLNPGAGVTLATGSLLDLNNFNSTIGSLSLSNASVLTGAGTLTLAGPLASGGDQTNLISGRLDLNGAVQTLSVADGAGADDLLLAANLDNGGVLKTGTGRLVLSGDNTYDGATLVGAGVLCAASDTALGKTTAGTVVSNEARLEVRGNVAIGAEPLRLNGSGQGWGALFSSAGTNSFGGTIRLDSATTIGAASGAALALSGNVEAGGHALSLNVAGELTLNGVISGDGTALTKTGAGTAVLGGPNPNTYVGLTTVNHGTLVLAKQTGPAIPAWLDIGGLLAPAIVRCDADDQFDVTTMATVRENGLLDLNGHDGSLAALTLLGGTVDTHGGRLDVLGPIDARDPRDSWLLGRVSILPGTQLRVETGRTLYVGAQLSGGSFIKWGTGRLVLTNHNTLNDESVVASGTVWVNNDPARGFGLGPGALIVESAPVLGGWEASLGGTGSISAPVTVRNHAILNPGTSVGTLFVSNRVTFGPNGWLQLDTDGPRIDVLELCGGGDLDIQPGAGLRLNGPLSGPGAYVFVKRARSIQGTFEGWPDGQPVPEQPEWFIHYGTQRIYFSRVPQTLAWFRALSTNGVVLVSWRTTLEIETTGFDLFRWEEGEGWVKVNPEPIPARGPEGGVYAVVDAGATTDFAYRYRLAEYASGGTEVHEFMRTPTEFAFTAVPVWLGDRVELRWRSRVDETYDVLGTEDLNRPLSAVVEGVPATPPENVLVLTTNAPTHFFRLRLSD